MEHHQLLLLLSLLLLLVLIVILIYHILCSYLFLVISFVCCQQQRQQPTAVAPAGATGTGEAAGRGPKAYFNTFTACVGRLRCGYPLLVRCSNSMFWQNYGEIPVTFRWSVLNNRKPHTQKHNSAFPQRDAIMSALVDLMPCPISLLINALLWGAQTSSGFGSSYPLSTGRWQCTIYMYHASVSNGWTWSSPYIVIQAENHMHRLSSSPLYPRFNGDGHKRGICNTDSMHNIFRLPYVAWHITRMSMT